MLRLKFILSKFRKPVFRDPYTNKPYVMFYCTKRWAAVCSIPMLSGCSSSQLNWRLLSAFQNRLR
jgi:hypothetical protein